MLPHIHLLGFKIPSYSLMIAIGFCSFLIWMYFALTKIEKVSAETHIRMLLVSVAGFAILGISAYIFNGIFHSIEKGKLVFGGITWLGGVIGGFPATLFLIHKFVPEAKGRELRFLSLIIPGIVLAHGIGRIGCFLGGCCYGAPTDSIFGVRFPEGSTAAEKYPSLGGGSVPLLPTQLFEAVFEIALFVVMLFGRKKLSNHNVELYCYAYGVFRFVLEFFRADNRGSTGIFLTPSQLICVILWISATLIILYKNGKIFKKLAEKSLKWQEEYKATLKKKNEHRLCCQVLSSANALRELNKLYKEEILTKEEYEKKKAELLERF